MPVARAEHLDDNMLPIGTSIVKVISSPDIVPEKEPGIRPCMPEKLIEPVTVDPLCVSGHVIVPMPVCPIRLPAPIEMLESAALRQERAEDEDRLVAALPRLGDVHCGEKAGASLRDALRGLALDGRRRPDIEVLRPGAGDGLRQSQPRLGGYRCGNPEPGQEDQRRKASSHLHEKIRGRGKGDTQPATTGGCVTVRGNLHLL